ncbi:hypothetical protein STCU_11646 [Strigomonas culicis]|uniref:Uncharacterized protein n=1 Tax=Strigomonas culicis TaxID=28005 RepID=S9THY9_9TRYP|nr:hypothetical protein STCU_11646 [Strigomonas culicis]|eukprot:EPY15958.1 hypothetical protein STCU_11646 [Strigomonas culicis]
MQPSETLFEDLGKDKKLRRFLLQHKFMKIVGNRRCAKMASKAADDIAISGTMKALHEGLREGENKVLENRPSDALTNILGGLVAMSAAVSYASVNGLKEMSQAQRMKLVAFVIREFLKTRSLTPSVETDALPFLTDPANLNPVGKGIVDVHTTLEEPAEENEQETNEEEGIDAPSQSKPKKIEKKIFTFSRVQMLLACCMYGTPAIHISSWDTFEVLSTVMFALYLNAFATDPNVMWSLDTFLQSLDPSLGDQEDDTNKKELGKSIVAKEKVNFQDLFSFKEVETKNAPRGKGYRRIPYKNNDLTEGDPTLKLIEDLKVFKEQDQLLAVMSPRSSPYADSFVVFGNVLFLIQSKKRIDFGKTPAEVRRELLKMGLIPDGYITPLELKKHARSILLTYTICEQLGLNHVIPVFCVEKRTSESHIPKIKVSFPDAEILKKAHAIVAIKKRGEKRIKKGGARKRIVNSETSYVRALTFEPTMEMKAIFSRTYIDEEPTTNRWVYEGTFFTD